jgi:hypothetical protein
MPQPDVLAVSEDVRESFQSVLQALPEVRDALAGQQDVVTVRPGYQYPAGGDSVPSVVVAVVPTPRRSARGNSKDGSACRCR